MNLRVFLRMVSFLAIIAAVAFVVYANVFVSGGKARPDGDAANTAVSDAGGSAGTAELQTAGGADKGTVGSNNGAASSNGAESGGTAGEANGASGGISGVAAGGGAAGQQGNASRSYVKNAETVKISALGDVALGQDSRFQYTDSFDYVFKKEKGDYGYFFSNVAGILSQDDLTIANLETTLSNEKNKAEKYDYGNNYWFNGDPKYVNILKAGSVEAVDLANNHTYDYGQKGYDATRKALEAAGVGYFGYSDVLVKDVKGIRVGMAGFNELGKVEQGVDIAAFKKEVAETLEKLRKECNLVIACFHWGKEYRYQYDQTQKELAYLAIDSGADLVLGSHPHVLQPIEKYKGRYIAYSLGNFCFGGNKTPKDYDTAIYQQSFIFDSDKTLQTVEAPEVVPCTVSSAKGFNNYRPAVATESQADDILKKLGLAAAQPANGPTAENDKKAMVELADFVKNIVIELRYATTNNITGKKIYQSNTAYLRRGTAEKLDKANRLLMKQGYRIKIWDAYRAQKYQQLLYDSAADKYYFADPKLGSNHTRGSAVDCTLVDAEGRELDMPSDFDEQSEKASRSYMLATPEQKKNALILENAMKSSGFIPLYKEWWHFDDSEYKSYGLLAEYPTDK